MLTPALQRADVVHVHSNGLLPEMAALLASRVAKPVVLTLYGTEIWHYRPRRFGPDLFTRAYHGASAVTFYTERLRSHAQDLGLTRRHMEVVYPPVAPAFTWHDEHDQIDARAELGIANRHLLVNVKRLHPLAGQRDLIEAMNEIIRVHPDTRLVICGTGPLLGDLQAMARSAGVERHVMFAGLVDNSLVARYVAAADLFVLPSLLEALPTVAVEALACGTPVISTDNPGGLELNDLFGPDVAIVPREQPARRWRPPSSTSSATSGGRCLGRETRSSDASVRLPLPASIARSTSGCAPGTPRDPRGSRGAHRCAGQRAAAGPVLPWPDPGSGSTSTGTRRGWSTGSIPPNAIAAVVSRSRGPAPRRGSGFLGWIAGWRGR